MVRGLRDNAEDKVTEAIADMTRDIVKKIEIIRDDCFDEHFTTAIIAEELDDLIKEIG